MNTVTRTAHCLVVLGLGLALGGSAWADAAPQRETLDLYRSFGELRSGSALAVHREAERVIVYDPYASEVVLAVDALHLETAGPPSSERPAPGTQAVTRVVRDFAGVSVYTHSITWRGARITVIAPGQVNPTGLHVVAFDNDDFTITDGAGLLIFQRRTAADGTLEERQGPAYGCGCERVTSPEGRVVSRELQRNEGPMSLQISP